MNSNQTSDDRPSSRRDYYPAPGRVTLLRQVVNEYLSEEADLVKPVSAVEVEEAFNIFAQVVRVGDAIPGGVGAFFEEGQTVTVEPSMLREVRLAPDLSVWIAPFAAVTGVFRD